MHDPQNGENENGYGEDAEGEPQSENTGSEESSGLSEIDSLKDQLLRAHAEMQNVRRRADRERQDAAKYGVSNFARDIIAVGDNLHRALDAVPQDALAGAPELLRNLVDGVKVTERELMSVLERHGIKAIDPLGEKFDPHFHQAMFEVPNTDAPEGTVVQVVNKGYVIGERLLRPALVGVAKRPAGA